MRSMVYSDESEMAMGSQRLNPLHNFKLPCLKWGNQRHLRCIKLGDASIATDSSSSFNDRHLLRRFHLVQRRRSPPSSKSEGLMVGGTRRHESESYPSNDYGREGRLRVSKVEAEEGIEAVREKIMKDLKTAADKIKDDFFRDKASDGDEVEAGENEFKEPKLKRKEKEKEREESPAVEVEMRPWNLRTRRAACKAPIDGGGTNNNYNSATRNKVINSLRVRDRGQPVVSAAADEKKKERSELSVTLSKQEIEEDFMVMVGRRPRKRPKKRARYVQKELDALFPGLLLTEVTVDSYKVPELIENGNVSSNIL
ncbi:Detected protein of unknown function [Hibiscus syriacus]|uniref:Uncharacterized protein n=1 Tax=Hibiscus syriacus TaxID=106335 RepID=A0A6A2WKT7_HIBSY|nr:uncharacterized protein LOC120197877 [Hibiscus syriacus]KAE8653770.1 Detected protein of unknown function [Hibiscus syriacus]